MTAKVKGLLCLILTLGMCLTASVNAQNPVVEAPEHPDRDPAFYVFGPQGSVLYGKEDCIQVVFFKVPVSAGSVTLYLWDPGSGGSREPASSLTGGNTITTDFTVYGGAGAFTGSQTTRPTEAQAGTVLGKLTTTNDHRDKWVALGPYSVNDGEVHGGDSYFKIAAIGKAGSGGNFFKAGSSVKGSEIFAYDATLHLAKDNRQRTTVWVEVPAGTTQVIEQNYDLDEGGVPYFAGQKLQAASSGKWVTNTISAPANSSTVRVPYEIDRTNKQAYSNGGFHFTDGAGHPLRMFFNPADAIVPPPAPAPAPVSNEVCTIDTQLVQLRQAMPSEAYLNQELTYTITVSAKQDVANVVVTDRLGDNVRYVKSEPAATVNGKNLTWTIGDMDAGQTQSIAITIVPTAEGMVRSCAVITADPRCCVGVFVGTPKLAITKTGPETALLGSDVTYQVTVTNTGTATAKDVVITDNIPKGLTHPSGQPALKLNVGDLAPNQSRTFPVTLKAAERGRPCNVAVAESSNAGRVEAQACTLIQAQGIDIVKDGTKEQFSGKTATYNIKVTNTGDTVLRNVVVTDTLPDRFQVLKVSDDGRTAGNTVTWTLPELAAGASKDLTLDVTTARSGELCNNVAVVSNEGLSDTAQACTLWKGHPALLIEVIDTIDPLLPGDETEYVIQVTNQGTADDHNVRITAKFPAQISAVEAKGDTATKVEADGKIVTVQPVATLTPKAMVEWRIRAKAVTTGDSRLRVELQSDLLKTPVPEEESTQVY